MSLKVAKNRLKFIQNAMISALWRGVCLHFVNLSLLFGNNIGNIFVIEYRFLIAILIMIMLYLCHFDCFSSCRSKAAF